LRQGWDTMLIRQWAETSGETTESHGLQDLVR
jgi:hypothetical protein